MTQEVVLITGGTGGIGAAFARYFAEKGFDLIITGRPGDKVYPCIKNLSEKHHVNVEIIPAELSKTEDVSKIENIIRENNGIEILINNAGFGLPNLFWEEDINSLEKMIMVHINAPMRFIYAALPNMMNKRKGIIINVSSLASFLPIPRDSVYSATKLFQNSLMESLHISLKEMGIKIQVLCPGFVRTDFHKNLSGDPAEMKKREIIPWMHPDEVVKISIKNLRRKNKVIIIPGFTSNILKFVYSIIPYPVYYQIANKYLS
jgi:short-subunit dehydrogenase